ncbi:MAG: DivIVA domain-containing protein [Acidimicrobiales bacterium]
MDGSSLVTQVEFDEVKKGYDPEQVENYLEQLGERLTLLAANLRKAVDRAEAAEARAVAALKERDAAVSRAEAAERKAAEAPPATSGGDDGTESIKKMLMLAQRTADSAVEEAQASAKNIVADARSKAAEIVGDAEQRAERLLIEAQKVGDEMMQEKSAAIVRTVSQLEARRDDLLEDTNRLGSYLSEHRQRLAETLASLQAGRGRRRWAARRSGAVVGGGAGRAPGHRAGLRRRPAARRSRRAVEPAGVGLPVPVPVPSSAPSSPAAVSSGPPSGGASAPSGGPSAPAASPRPAASPSPAESPGTVPITPPSQGSGRPSSDEPKASLLIAEPAPEVADPADLQRAAELIEAPQPAPRPSLFDAEIEAPEIVDAAYDTRELSAEERDALLADGDPLGPTDQVADEAMRKFFDEEPADERKRRFRRS